MSLFAALALLCLACLAMAVGAYVAVNGPQELLDRIGAKVFGGSR